MSKHVKSKTPTDADLRGNPMIGGSKGLTLSGATDEDLDDIAGENTIEGDVENDTNAAGGVDKAESDGSAANQTRKQERTR